MNNEAVNNLEPANAEVQPDKPLPHVDIGERFDKVTFAVGYAFESLVNSWLDSNPDSAQEVASAVGFAFSSIVNDWVKSVAVIPTT